jgi:hypothetical protein
MMTLVLLYLGALALFVLGGFLVRRTSAYSRSGGAEFEKRMKRRAVGMASLSVGGLLLALAVLSQFSANLQ